MTPKQAHMMTRVMEAIPDVSTLEMRDRNPSEADWYGGVPDHSIYFRFDLAGFGRIDGRINASGTRGCFTCPGYSDTARVGKIADVIGCPSGCEIRVVPRNAFFSFHEKDQFISAADMAKSVAANRKTDICLSLVEATSSGIEPPFQKRYMRVIKNRDLA